MERRSKTTIEINNSKTLNRDQYNFTSTKTNQRIRSSKGELDSKLPRNFQKVDPYSASIENSTTTLPNYRAKSAYLLNYQAPLISARLSRPPFVGPPFNFNQVKSLRAHIKKQSNYKSRNEQHKILTENFFRECKVDDWLNRYRENDLLKQNKNNTLVSYYSAMRTYFPLIEKYQIN